MMPAPTKGWTAPCRLDELDVIPHPVTAEELENRPWWINVDHLLEVRDDDDPQWPQRNEFRFPDPRPLLAIGRRFLDGCMQPIHVEDKIVVTGGATINRVPLYAAHKPALNVGLALSLGCDVNTLNATVLRKNASGRICKFLMAHCFQQKVTGAATGIFRENIISRETGLSENYNAQILTADVTPPPKWELPSTPDGAAFVHPDDVTGLQLLTSDELELARDGKMPLIDGKVVRE